MTAIQKAIEEYLAMRRSLGFVLRLEGGRLRQFGRFLAHERAARVTIELALRWAQEPATAQPTTWADRLATVRRFAQYRSNTDSRTEIPPTALLPHRYHRKAPYIYSDDDVLRLIKAARQLPSEVGLRPYTYVTLLGVLAVTGMRISEVVSLTRGDVDLEEGVLLIRRTKFGKSRLIPVHASTRRALASYALRRDRIHRRPQTDSFLVNDRGSALKYETASWTFVRLSRVAGLRAPSSSHGRGPRLHDFRHTWAVKTMVRLYRAGRDVEPHMARLATYLGHVDIAATYWYLSAVPELLQLATARLEGPRRGRTP